MNERVALYLRVSTEGQDIAGQERELLAEASRRGWDVVRTYAEKVTGTGRLQRKEYDQVLAEARNPERGWDRLLVWSLDRFSREVTFTKATQAVLDLERGGVRFHSLREPTLDSPEDGKANLGRDVLLAILPVIASFESTRRSERVRLAMTEIKLGRRSTRSGKPPGRQRKVTQEQVVKAATLRRTGLPWAEVAQRVGLKAETVRRAVWEAQRAKVTVGNPHRSQGSA